MNGYEKPVVIETTEMSEGVFALNESGGGENGGTVEVNWTNHNSGSHSDLEIKVHIGPSAGEYIRVTATFVGNGNITQWGGLGGGYTSVNMSGNSITFIREGHYNPGENFQFSFGQVKFDGNGDDHDTAEHVGSYYEGQGKGYLGDAIGKGDFVIDYQIS